MTQDHTWGCTRLFTDGPAFGVARIHLHIDFTSPQSGTAGLPTERGRNLCQRKEFLTAVSKLDALARPDGLRFGLRSRAS